MLIIKIKRHCMITKLSLCLRQKVKTIIVLNLEQYNEQFQSPTILPTTSISNNTFKDLSLQQYYQRSQSPTILAKISVSDNTINNLNLQQYSHTYQSQTILSKISTSNNNIKDLRGKKTSSGIRVDIQRNSAQLGIHEQNK